MVAPDVFTGELEERQPMEFLQALERHCMEVGCEDYVYHTGLYLKYGSRAYNWYTNTLTDEQREDSWEEFSKLFNAKFPSLAVKPISSRVYRDELLALTITIDDLKKIHPDSNMPWHEHYANQLLQLATYAEIADTCAYMDFVWKKMPNVLQQRVGNEYDNWSQFTAAIEDIQWSTLEAAIDYQEEMWRMIITQMGTHDGKTRSEKERGVQLKVD
ncbi:hypothetical protein BDP27DRAFT_100869 [Rhodocollybia butyracea]|uniref:Uncharacterized protein n=1 Tax=Rhodocollybia butyracea TaxID=206335 RepID=A0A9P5Q7I2_9AGAR|nr:hypothetical protein BDP27DRAFT_100869 [Rhodocollybia butyracea]